MNYKHSCVIDTDGYYKTVVLQLCDTDGNWEVQYCTLSDGESLVDTGLPSFRPYAGAPGLVRPRWDGEAWTEGATAEEITAWETEHPAPVQVGPTMEERNRADIDYLLVMGGYTDELV